MVLKRFDNGVEFVVDFRCCLNAVIGKRKRMMRRWFLGGLLCCTCWAGCRSVTEAQSSDNVVDPQCVAISNSLVGWEEKSASIHAQLEKLNPQIDSLNQRIEKIEARVRLLIEIERSNVCLHHLPEDVARSEEIQTAHMLWLAATQAQAGQQPSAEEIEILQHQFVQAVQRSVVTESTLLQVLSGELEQKEKEAAKLRVKMLEVDRQIQDLEQTLKQLQK